jgi:AraC-like DNA-binding protein
MKSAAPIQKVSLWRKEHLFNIDFASYTLYNHSFSKHFHDHYVIELVVSGADEFYCNGKNFTATKDQLVFINPGEVHTGSTVAGTPLCYHSLLPDKKTFEKIAGILEKKLPANLFFEKTLFEQPHLVKKLEALFTLFQHSCNEGKEEEIFLDLMYDILSTSNNNIAQAHSNEDSRVRSLIDFIKANFKRQLSLQNFAEIVNLNPFHLLRLFKKSTGLSPYDYLIFTRIEFAKTILKRGLPVQEVARDAGFYDTSHFCRLFKRSTGISPKDYRSYKSQYHTIFAA